MCAGAIINARVPTVYYGAQDAKGGAIQSLYHLLEDQRLNHRAFVQSDVRAKESSLLLQQFFAKIRAKRKQK